MMSSKKKSSRKKRKKKNRSKWSPLEIGILVIAAVMLLISGFKLISILVEYKAGSDAYEDLRKKYVRVIGEKVEKLEEQAESESDSEPEAVDFPNLVIDFEQLSTINGAMTGWIYVPALDMEYPVVKGTDNAYYLSHTFEKKENTAGAIFMDSDANPLMTDYNTFIYGHNMKNGSMFGKLKNFIRNEELYDSCPYIYYFTREKNYQYLIISYYVTQDGSYSYFKPENDMEYENYLDYILTNSVHRCTEKIPRGEQILSLSTCYGSAGGTQRLLVHGILTATQDVQ